MVALSLSAEGPGVARACPFQLQVSSISLSLKPNQLSYSRRLHYRGEFRRFFDQSQVFRLQECTVFRIENGLSHFRVGITLKAKGSSVERNAVKRQIREFFRTHASSLGSYDYNVVVPQSKLMQWPYPQKLRDCLNLAFLKRVTTAHESFGLRAKSH